MLLLISGRPAPHSISVAEHQKKQIGRHLKSKTLKDPIMCLLLVHLMDIIRDYSTRRLNILNLEVLKSNYVYAVDMLSSLLNDDHWNWMVEHLKS